MLGNDFLNNNKRFTDFVFVTWVTLRGLSDSWPSWTKQNPCSYNYSHVTWMQHYSLIIYLSSLSRAQFSPAALTTLVRTRPGFSRVQPTPVTGDSRQRWRSRSSRCSRPSVPSVRPTHRGVCASVSAGAPWRGWPPQVTRSRLLQWKIKARTHTHTHTHTHTNGYFSRCVKTDTVTSDSWEFYRENVPMEKPTSGRSSCGPNTNFCSAAASDLWKT